MQNLSEVPFLRRRRYSLGRRGLSAVPIHSLVVDTMVEVLDHWVEDHDAVHRRRHQHRSLRALLLLLHLLCGLLVLEDIQGRHKGARGVELVSGRLQRRVALQRRERSAPQIFVERELAGVETVSVGVRVVVREEREDLRGVVLPLHPAHNRHVLDRVPGLVCTLPHRRHQHSKHAGRRLWRRGVWNHDLGVRHEVVRPHFLPRGEGEEPHAFQGRDFHVGGVGVVDRHLVAAVLEGFDQLLPRDLLVVVVLEDILSVCADAAASLVARDLPPLLHRRERGLLRRGVRPHLDFEARRDFEDAAEGGRRLDAARDHGSL
mmetsp:Transcript_21182/g.50111  ORF Transcript_21182/g.50111 Transcript_21182/m.50111 type:complete len:318 (+) Transcript_21182:931-1884(+)